jgi:hypothetical protein
VTSNKKSDQAKDGQNQTKKRRQAQGKHVHVNKYPKGSDDQKAKK